MPTSIRVPNLKFLTLPVQNLWRESQIFKIRSHDHAHAPYMPCGLLRIVLSLSFLHIWFC